MLPVSPPRAGQPQVPTFGGLSHNARMAPQKHPHGPRMTLGNICESTARSLVAVCIAGFASGCTSSVEDALSPYAAPGKFDFLDCQTIAQRLKTASDRERELTDL